jgi:hypothetical protein
MGDAGRPTGTPAALDLAIAFASSALATAGTLERGATAVARPLAAVLLHPPMVARRYQPGTWLGGVARRGGRRRDEAVRELSAWLDRVVPVLATELLRRIDLTEAVRRYVDLNGLVAGVDVDAVATRLDVDAVAQRLDIEAVMNRLDLTSIVRERVDIDAVVDTVDLDAAAARLDIDAIIARVDLAGLAQDVIAEIDLPEIIRESTGSVASETVRGVRMRGISGDDAVGRAVDRLRHRRQPAPGVVTREP